MAVCEDGLHMANIDHGTYFEVIPPITTEYSYVYTHKNMRPRILYNSHGMHISLDNLALLTQEYITFLKIWDME